MKVHKEPGVSLGISIGKTFFVIFTKHVIAARPKWRTFRWRQNTIFLTKITKYRSRFNEFNRVQKKMLNDFFECLSLFYRWWQFCHFRQECHQLYSYQIIWREKSWFFFPRRKSIFPRNFSRQNSQKSIYAQRAFSRQITPCSSRYVLYVNN